MDKLDAVAFAKQIIRISESFEEVTHYDVNILDNLVAKIRIYLSKIGFIDVFYNADTQRIAYSLIQNEKRIFGVDNTGGWHIHPFAGPEDHIASKEIPFVDFVNMLKEKLEK